MVERIPPVLYAEDSESDAFIMQYAFDGAGVTNPLQTVSNGQEAIDYLQGLDQYADRQRFPLPCLLITDLKIPKVDGFDLLTWLQGQPRFNDLPRLAFSSSYHQSDLQRSLQLGAHAYFVKPSSHPVLVEMVRGWKDSYLSAHCSHQLH